MSNDQLETVGLARALLKLAEQATDGEARETLMKAAAALLAPEVRIDLVPVVWCNASPCDA